MGKTFGQNWQDVNEAALKVLGTPARTDDEVILGKINSELDSPLRMFASFPTNDAWLNFAAAPLTLADGAKRALAPMDNKVFTGTQSAINFQTQATSGGFTFDITWPTSNTLNYFRVVGFMLLDTGHIKANFTAEKAANTWTSDEIGALFDDGTPIGFMFIKCTDAANRYFKTANSATSIIENADIYRFSAGAGGGGGNAFGAFTNEPTGIYNRTLSKLSVSGSAMRIEPTTPGTSFYVFVKGKKFTKSALESVTPSPLNVGQYYFYYDTAGVLTYQTSFDETLLTTKAYVVSAYWDGTAYIFKNDERHGITMDGDTHAELHNAIGFLYRSGLTETAEILPSGSPTDNRHQFLNIAAGVLSDEDIKVTVVPSYSPANLFEQNLGGQVLIQTVVSATVTFQSNHNLSIGDMVFFFTSSGVYRGSQTVQTVNSSVEIVMDGAISGLVNTDYLLNFSKLPVVYFAGASKAPAVWTNNRWKYAFYYGVDSGDADNNNYPYYNQNNAGTWQMTQAASDDFVSYWVIATSDWERPIYLLPSQTVYSSLANAIAGESIATIDWGNFPAKENKVLYRVIYQCQSSYTNSQHRCKIVQVDDFRAVYSAPVAAAGAPVLHSALGGLEYTSSGHTGFQRATYATNSNPTINNDAVDTAGIGRLFVAGDVWLNTLTSLEYYCASNSIGAAVWVEYKDSAINELLERVRNNLNTSLWLYGGYIIPTIDQATKTSSATATLRTNGYLFSSVGNALESVNLLGNDFYTQLTDIPQIRLDAFYDVAQLDSNAEFYVSRDGANEWQQVTMVRDGVTDFINGELSFADEATFGYAPANLTSTQLVLNASNQFQVAFTIATLNTVLKQIDSALTKTGTPSGYCKLQIVNDNAGSPGTTVYFDSNWSALSSITTGTKQWAMTTVLAPATYWVLILTDAAYKASYSAGVHQLSIDTDAIALKGREQDLRIKVVGGTSDKLLTGLAIYHTKTTAGATVLDTDNESAISDFEKESFDDYVVVEEITVPNTTIVNRAKVKNLNNDLLPRMATETILMQDIYRIENESGPNGEPIWGIVGDINNSIRFIGTPAVGSLTNGTAINLSVGVSCEIVFAGTGLNMLINTGALPSCDARATIDGGVEGSNFLVSTSNVLNNRGYATNEPRPVVSGLNYGLHTVTIRNADATYSPRCFGFEILNEAEFLKVPTGLAYVDKQQILKTSLSSESYNSGFETGVLGTKGGRVLTYLKSNGTIGKALTPAESAPLYTSAANHDNEEMVREYMIREFGCGRADDFSTLTSASARAFTLDDNLTTLLTSNGLMIANNGAEGLTPASDGAFIEFAFFGSGLDLVLWDTNTGGNDSYTYSIDGGTAVAWPYTAGSAKTRIQKICSGLHIGTHKFRLNRVSVATWSPTIVAFKTYVPKKPALPVNTLELSEYYINADFVANTAGLSTVSSGVVRRHSVSGEIYNGTWSIALDGATVYADGWQTWSTATNSYVEFTFVGYGFEYKASAWPTYSATNAVTINGLAATVANFPTLQSGVTGSFAFSSGNINFSGGSTRGSSFYLKNLPYGKYTVRITAGTSNPMPCEVIDIITPIYSPRYNSPYQLRGVASIGNCSIQDNRKTNIKTPILKFVGRSIASDNFTTTSTTLVARTIFVPVYSKGGWYRIGYSAQCWNTSSSGGVGHALFVDGVQATVEKSMQASYIEGLSDYQSVYLSKGFHFVQLYIRAINTGTAYGYGNFSPNNYPDIKVEEV